MSFCPHNKAWVFSFKTSFWGQGIQTGLKSKIREINNSKRSWLFILDQTTFWLFQKPKRNHWPNNDLSSWFHVFDSNAKSKKKKKALQRTQAKDRDCTYLFSSRHQQSNLCLECVLFTRFHSKTDLLPTLLDLDLFSVSGNLWSRFSPGWSRTISDPFAALIKRSGVNLTCQKVGARSLPANGDLHLFLLRCAASHAVFQGSLFKVLSSCHRKSFKNASNHGDEFYLC